MLNRAMMVAIVAAAIANATADPNLNPSSNPSPKSNGTVANQQWQQQVWNAESAFAATMAARDIGRFASFVAEDARFFNGNQPLRGREQIVAAWQRFFDAEQAPFSWQPQLVEVLPGGHLALSSGPVLDAAGNCVGTYNSVWQRNGDLWQVIIDRGAASCEFPQVAEVEPKNQVD